LADKNKLLWALIMAGGNGTRLWPLSTPKKPKQFLDLSESNLFQKNKTKISKENLLEQTIERVKGIIPNERILIAGSSNHRKLIQKSSRGIPKSNLIFEPESRNTATTICLASHLIKEIDSNAIMTVLPSDHYIGNLSLFRRILNKGTQYAKEDKIITLGIEPTSPEVGFGYIEKGNKIFTSKTINTHEIKSFKEKPVLKQAQSFLKSKRFLWNGGYFILKVSKGLEELKRFEPKIYAYTKEASFFLKKRNISKFNTVFKQCKKISFDHAIMEKTKDLIVISSNLEWNDLGSWASFDKIFKNDSNKNTWLVDKNTNIISENSQDLVIGTNKKFVIASDVKDLIIIEHGDGLLICRKSKANKIGIFANKMEKSFSKKIDKK
tara:strand:+ start:20342 stop:21481 length:1140 start_codon:yes stop_codon:yes gene_type:complete